MQLPIAASTSLSVAADEQNMQNVQVEQSINSRKTFSADTGQAAQSYIGFLFFIHDRLSEVI